MSGSCSKAHGARRRRGSVLMYGSLLTALVIVPFMGLAIDVGLMYLVQSRLSAAADAATIAGASALSRGSDDSSQRANAVSTANNYFHANFPTGYLWTTNLQVDSVAATDSTYLRSITTTASVQVPMVFLRVLKFDNRTISISAKATRRDINIMVVMDRSGSLNNSYNGQPAACSPLKSAAVNFVDQFAETRDNVGLITFATSSNIDYAPSTTFKNTVESYIRNINCTGATSSAQALWQAYDQLVRLNQNGALNAILFFTDGRPTSVTEDFPLKGNCASHGTANPRRGVLTLGYSNNVPSSPMGLYNWVAPGPPPLSSDLSVISDHNSCYFASNQQQVASDISYAPLTDIWGNSLTQTGYRSVTYSGSGLNVTSAQNIENFATNAADHAALRIRRGDPDPAQANRSLAGVVIYAIGFGDVDNTLLQRIANDPALNPNPVAAGNQGRYYNAPNTSDLNHAFMQVASQMLRIAQ